MNGLHMHDRQNVIFYVRVKKCSKVDQKHAHVMRASCCPWQEYPLTRIYCENTSSITNFHKFEAALCPLNLQERRTLIQGITCEIRNLQMQK